MCRKYIILLALVLLAGCVKAPPPSIPAAPDSIPKVHAAGVAAKAATKEVAPRSAKDVGTLEEALASGLPVVVELGSDSCYWCRQMKPIMEELRLEYYGAMVFLTLDVYQHKGLASKFDVTGIPAFVFYDHMGEPKGKVEGAMSKDELLRTAKGFGII